MAGVGRALDEVLASVGSPTNPDGGSLDIRDIYGHDKSEIELLQLIEKSQYLVYRSASIPFLTSQNKWSFKRHTNNRLRGDRSTIEGHKKVMQTVGLLQDLGGEPFAVQTQDVDVEDEYELCHWASRSEGLKEAWEEDVAKTNQAVQISVQNGFKRVKVFARNSPDWLTIFLVALGNMGNSEATISTVLEKWASTTDIESAFKRKAKVMQWTTMNLTQSQHDETKFTFVNSLRRNWWVTYKGYEVCNSFYKEVVRTPMGRIEPGVTEDSKVWQVLHDKMKTEVDTRSMTVQMQEKVFRAANDILRILKGECPYAVVDCILLFMPPNGGGGWGKCSLLPTGLPLLTQYSLHGIKSLLTPMSDTSALQKHQAAKTQQDKEENLLRRRAEGRGGRAGGARGGGVCRGSRGRGRVARSFSGGVCRGGRVRGSGAARSRSGAGPPKAAAAAADASLVAASGETALIAITNGDQEKEEPTDQDFTEGGDHDIAFDSFEKCQAYMRKIDATKSQSAKIVAFKYAALYGCLSGSPVPIWIKGKKKLVKGYDNLRKIWKQDMYKSSRKLQPRASDADFPSGAFVALEDDADEQSQNEQNIEQALEELKDNFPAVEAFLEENHVGEMPTLAHLVAGKALNATMLAMLQATSGGNPLEDPDKAYVVVTKAAHEQVGSLMPAKFEEVAAFIDMVRSKQQEGLLKHCPSAEALFKRDFGVFRARCEIMSLTMHIISTLGVQQFLKREGPVVIPKPYLAQLGISIAKGLSELYDLSRGSIDSKPTVLNDMLVAGDGSWESFYEALMGEIDGLVIHTTLHDGIGFNDKLRTLTAELTSCKAKGAAAILEQFHLDATSFEITAQIEVFPAARQELLVKVEEKFKSLHPAHVKAAAILENPIAYLLNSLKEAYSPSGPPRPPNGEQLVGKDGNAAADASGTADAVDEDPVMPLQRYLKRLADKECEDADDAKFSVRQTRIIVAALNFKVAELPGANEVCNLCVSRLDFAEEMGKIRFVVQGDGSLRIPFQGRVVDAKLAGNLNKSMLLPLGDSDKHGPALFVDGSGCWNSSRSDWSCAWFIAKLPAPKENTTGKKQKTGQQQKPGPIATHKIVFEPICFKVGGEAYRYQLPYLVDIKFDGEDMRAKLKDQGGVLYRERIAFDSQELVRIKKSKLMKSFVTM